MRWERDLRPDRRVKFACWSPTIEGSRRPSRFPTYWRTAPPAPFGGAISGFPGP